MVETFGSLGIPFPLFEAPVEEAVEYCGSSTCSVCSRSAAHCFILDIGCALVVPCPSCSIPNGLDAHDHRDQACVACGETLPFPELGDGAIHICYGCLREGHGAITTDTELGMISWEQVQAGHTHGLPGLARADFEMVPLEGGWVGAKLPRDMMLELLRTPNYLTIQGERWQFCCKGPMVYVGSWPQGESAQRSPEGDVKKYFERMVQDPAADSWEDLRHEGIGVYVFRCRECGRLTSHWDID